MLRCGECVVLGVWAPGVRPPMRYLLLGTYPIVPVTMTCIYVGEEHTMLSLKASV